MKVMIAKAMAWRVAILKCSLYVIIGAGSIWCATVQSWDGDFVSSLRWWNWSFIIVSLVVNACKDIITFIDKTHQVEGDKIKQAGDTDFFRKQTQ